MGNEMCSRVVHHSQAICDKLLANLVGLDYVAPIKSITEACKHWLLSFKILLIHLTVDLREPDDLPSDN